MEGTKVAMTTPAEFADAVRAKLTEAGIADVDKLVEAAHEAARQHTGPTQDIYIFSSAWFFFITPY